MQMHTSSFDERDIYDPQSVVASNRVFYAGNLAHQHGGGMSIAFSRSQVSLSSSFFANNSAANNGGALYAIGSTAVLENTKLLHNRAHVGGGVYSMSRVEASDEGDWATQLFEKDLMSLTVFKNCDLELNKAVKGGAFAVMGLISKVSTYACTLHVPNTHL
jgi:predicted outer membrane repeat protein